MWEDYSDFISNFRDDLEEPYISPDEVSFERMLKTNTLGDYLGIPTQKTGLSLSASTSVYRCTPSGSTNDKGLLFIDSDRSWDTIFSQWTGVPNAFPSIHCATASPNAGDTVVLHGVAPLRIGKYASSLVNLKLTTTLSFKSMPCRIIVYSTALKSKFYVDSEFALFDQNKTAILNASLGNIAEKLGITKDSASDECTVDILIPYTGLSSPTTFVTAGQLKVSAASELSEVTYKNYPFKTKTNESTRPRLLAYRFRAYESVYNAYYRDIRNNPFVVNGRPVYNKWLPTMKGGADETLYELHQCNWERDFLTTAVPNPQQGANAPLVGLTVGDVITRSDDGTLSVQKQTVLVDEDGSKYGISYKVSEDGERLVGVDYDPVSEKRL